MGDCFEASDVKELCVVWGVRVVCLVGGLHCKLEEREEPQNRAAGERFLLLSKSHWCSECWPRLPASLSALPLIGIFDHGAFTILIAARCSSLCTDADDVLRGA